MLNYSVSVLETERRMHDLLVEFNKDSDPNYIAIENLLISYMYTTCIAEDTIYNIFKDFCKTGTLPALNTIPEFRRRSYAC